MRGRVDTDELAFVRAMARAGAGIGLLPVNFVGPLVAAGALERVLPRHARRSSPVHVVWPSRRLEPAAVTLFRDALVEALPRSLGDAARAGSAAVSPRRRAARTGAPRARPPGAADRHERERSPAAS